MSGRLFLVATPIGNYDDFTFRAVRILKEADLVVCEELKEGNKLLRFFRIEKPLETLNEHNEGEKTPELINILEDGKTIALTSDCGMPVFTDPGKLLVREAIRIGIPVIPIPGPSSILPALVLSGFPTDSFVFPGWLSQKREQRRRQLEELKGEKRTMLLMDTPYRLLPLLSDLVDVLGEEREVCVAVDLTKPTEEFLRGRAKQVLEQVKGWKEKKEFIVVVEGRRKS